MAENPKINDFSSLSVLEGFKSVTKDKTPKSNIKNPVGLVFAAFLRLPCKMSRRQKYERRLDRGNIVDDDDDSRQTKQQAQRATGFSVTHHAQKRKRSPNYAIGNIKKREQTSPN
ncbi:hypothetical protein RND71_009634 [Anisodus tanguticus]|uniref:Uncharacterized protein n=1 Tax=Anisodus tanguticus TaxID=243964 RepID=A0AAE1SIE8_9SOLA|nr:hypothetical protein RND71_009634 [Anisodus tanguticus]